MRVVRCGGPLGLTPALPSPYWGYGLCADGDSIRLRSVFGHSPPGADSVSWYLDTQGEIVVGSILDAMPPDTVFHSK